MFDDDNDHHHFRQFRQRGLVNVVVQTSSSFCMFECQQTETHTWYWPWLKLSFPSGQSSLVKRERERKIFHLKRCYNRCSALLFMNHSGWSRFFFESLHLNLSARYFCPVWSSFVLSSSASQNLKWHLSTLHVSFSLKWAPTFVWPHAERQTRCDCWM